MKKHIINLWSIVRAAEDLSVAVVITIIIFIIGIHAIYAQLTATTNNTSTTSANLAQDIIPPTVPLGLYSTNITATEVTIIWQNSIDPDVSGQFKSGVKGYRIFKDNEPSYFANSSVNYFMAQNLTPGMVHTFSVSAFDNQGNISMQSAPIAVVLLNATAIPTATSNTTTSNIQEPTSTSTTGTTTTSTTPSINTATTPPVLQNMWIDPPSASVNVGNNLVFRSRSSSTGELLSGVVWGVYELNGGSINNFGIYLPPPNAGSFHVIAKVSGYIDSSTTVLVKTSGDVTNIVPVSTTTITPTIVPTTTAVPATISNTSITTPSLNIAKTVEDTSKVIVPTTVTSPKTIIVKPVAPKVVMPEVLVPPTPIPSSELPKTSIPPETTVAIEHIQNIATSVGIINTTIDNSKKMLLDIVDARISKITSVNDLSGASTDLKSLNTIRKDVIKELDQKINNQLTITPDTANEIKSIIADRLDKIDASGANENEINDNHNSTEVTGILDTLVETVDDQSKVLKNQGGDLLHKDSNADGISDYESIYVYNLDPINPSPVTEFEGKKITAGEKLLLGYDLQQKDLVKITPEEPATSVVPVNSTYKVQNIKFTKEKKIVLKGQALPNSFITVYIYSTPIIVVVKTNDSGDWEYTLDKELETGEHKIYTASVNNSGKIVARSTGYTFIKTAESATLDTAPIVQTSSQIQKPGLVNNNNMYLLAIILISFLGLSIGLIGITSKSSSQGTDQN